VLKLSPLFSHNARPFYQRVVSSASIGEPLERHWCSHYGILVEARVIENPDQRGFSRKN